ncbi:MAG: hypothetical protein LBU69_01370 [Deltaproteobacteria bacterium]|jgi:hypothetical protein|nr:hypothetical protein [Deltaproteobacteria bacterium]
MLGLSGFDVKSLMLVQVILEAILVLLLAFWLYRSRKKAGPADLSAVPGSLNDSIERFLVESEKLAETFQANLRDKKDLTSDLILKLDRRLADYRELLLATEESIREAEKNLLKLGGEIGEQVMVQAQAQLSQAQIGQAKANPAAPEVRAMVLQLAKKGLTVEDIAVKARLHRGEVELIIDLESQFSV